MFWDAFVVNIFWVNRARYFFGQYFGFICFFIVYFHAINFLLACLVKYRVYLAIEFIISINGFLGSAFGCVYILRVFAVYARAEKIHQFVLDIAFFVFFGSGRCVINIIVYDINSAKNIATVCDQFGNNRAYFDLLSCLFLIVFVKIGLFFRYKSAELIVKFVRTVVVSRISAVIVVYFYILSFG